jgi:hypothetical protein
MIRGRLVGWAMVVPLFAAALALETRAVAQGIGRDSVTLVQESAQDNIEPGDQRAPRAKRPFGAWSPEFSAVPFTFRYGVRPEKGYRFYYRYWYGEGHPHGYPTWSGNGMPYDIYYPRPYIEGLGRSRNVPSAVQLEPAPGEGVTTPAEVIARVQAAWRDGSEAPLMPLLSRSAFVGVAVAGRPATAVRLSQNEFLERLRGAFASIRTDDIQVDGLRSAGVDRREATAHHDYSPTVVEAQSSRDSASATLTVTTTRRGGRWFLTSIAAPSGHPLLAEPTVIASR